MKNQTSLQHCVSSVGTQLTEVRNKMLRAGVAVAILVCTSAQAMLMEVKNRSDMPVAGLGYISTVSLSPTNFSQSQGGASLAQTFQVATEFEVGAIWWQFRDNTGLNTTATLDLAIYQVADVNDTNGLTLGDLVWDLDGVVAPGFSSTDSKSVRGELEAGEVFTLAATTGTAGYAFVWNNTMVNNTDYRLMRTANNTSDPYDGGRYYSGGAAQFTSTGGRDVSLAFEAVPEPSAAALAGMGLVLLAWRMRANRAA